jgi:hypothetical protein
VVNNNSRSAIFLSNVFSVIPSVKDTPAQRSQTNIFYIPLKENEAHRLIADLIYQRSILALFDPTGDREIIPQDEKPHFRVTAKDFVPASAEYAKSFYDFKLARSLLYHLCDSPAEDIKAACEGDLSRGPYIFSYTKPASKVTPVPPPFLFMDLSDVHERAFPEIIAAFRAQVKRDDISDRAKIDTLRLKLLSIVLTAADWLVPMQKAVADIVHSASGQSEKDKK